MTVFIFALNNPRTTEVFGFDFLGPGVLYMTFPNHQLLQDLPKDEADLANRDVYVQQFDAFLKGQLNLDFTADPRLEKIDAYDQSDRNRFSDLKYLYDRSYYDGKFYVYYGLAPIILAYAPIYFFTEQVPSPPFAAFILMIMAVISMYMALTAVLNYFKPQANLILIILGETAAIFAPPIYLSQMYPSFYVIVSITAVFSVGIYIYSLLSALNYARSNDIRKANALFFLAGVAIVLTVMSRQLALLYAVAFSAPFFIIFIKENINKLNVVIRYYLFLTIPILIGAIFIFWFNYARFGNIFEFGNHYNLCGNNLVYDNSIFSFAVLKDVIFYFILEPLSYIKNFPFVELSSEVYRDYGAHMYIQSRVSVLGIPFSLFMICGYALFNRDSFVSRELGWHRHEIKYAFILVLIFLVIASYISFAQAGYLKHYTCDPMSIIIYLSFILLIYTFIPGEGRNQNFVYFISSMLCVFSIVVMFFLTISNFEGQLEMTNPDAYQVLKIFFDPWTN